MNKLNELIKVNYENENKPTVSGRELHEVLEVGTRYNDWFERMCEYGFVEGEDYYSFLSNRIDGKAGKPRNDHQLTIDMAKEICMVQRTEKGKMFRQYFIEIEKKFFEEKNNKDKRSKLLLNIINSTDVQQALAIQNFENYVKQPLLEEISSQKEIIDEQENLIQEQKPKVEYHDNVLNNERLINISSIAKDLGLTATKLNKILNMNGIIYKYGNSWFPYADYQWLITEGYADYKIYEDNSMPQQLKWTEKGRQWIIDTFFDKITGFGNYISYRLKLK